MEWISVKDKLPQDYDVVFFINEAKDIGCAQLLYIKKKPFWYYFCECYEGSSPENITHWMPLPEGPK